MDSIDALLEKPYRIIDILPRQVPADSPGRYFALEPVLRRDPAWCGKSWAFCNVLLGGALLTADPEDTYMTLYGADEDLLSLTRALAAAEGLFLWE